MYTYLCISMNQNSNLKPGRWLSQRESLALWRKLMSSPSSVTVKSQVNFSSIVFHNSSFHLLTLSDHLQLPQQVVPVCQHGHGQSKFWQVFQFNSKNNESTCSYIYILHMRKNEQFWKLMRRIFVVVNVPFKVLLKYTEYDQPHESQTNSDILETIHRWEPKKYLFVSLCFFRKGLVGFL